MEVDLAELANHLEEKVGLVEFGDLGMKLELLDDLPGIGREPGYVGPEVVGKICRVIEQLLEPDPGGVVEGVP